MDGPQVTQEPPNLDEEVYESLFSGKKVYIFFNNFFLAMPKFLGQGLNPGHSSNPNC